MKTFLIVTTWISLFYCFLIVFLVKQLITWIIWVADIYGVKRTHLPLPNISTITVYMRRPMPTSEGSDMLDLLLIFTWKYTVMREWNHGVWRKVPPVVRPEVHHKLLYILLPVNLVNLDNKRRILLGKFTERKIRKFLPFSIAIR